jgi:hypothetical protein
MVLSASLTLKWDCGLRQMQKEIQKFRNGTLSIRNFMLMTKTPSNYSFEHLSYGHEQIKVLKGLKRNGFIDPFDQTFKPLTFALQFAKGVNKSIQFSYLRSISTIKELSGHFHNSKISFTTPQSKLS